MTLQNVISIKTGKVVAATKPSSDWAHNTPLVQVQAAHTATDISAAPLGTNPTASS